MTESPTNTNPWAMEAPARHRHVRGGCRCQACAVYARRTIRDGSTFIQWGQVNAAVHGADDARAEINPKSEPQAGHSMKHAMDCLSCQKEAQRLRDGGVRWVSWSAVRDAVHGGVAYSPEPDVVRPPSREVGPAKRRHRHLYGMEMPFSFTFDQAVGFAAGLSLSLPVISVLGLGPDVGVYVAAGLTALGTSTPWLISKARDTEKPEAPAVTTAAPVAAPVKPPSRSARLASASKDHEAIVMAWAQYETDVALQIDFPAMTDVRRPETSALAKALRAAEIASRHAGDDLDSVIRYEAAVLDLEAAFKVAEAAAKLDASHPLTTNQKDLAHTLLAITVDPAGNVHERRQAHARLLKLLDGVIILAEPARIALEAAATRGELSQ